MNYRANKTEDILRRAKNISKAIEKEKNKEAFFEKTSSISDASDEPELREEEFFKPNPDDEYFDSKIRSKDKKNNQKQMAKNKSKKFDMYNTEDYIRDIYLKMDKECPLAFVVFQHLCNKKCSQNFCEISQREIAKEVNAPLSEVEKAMKYLYNKKVVCLLNKKDLKDLEFDRKELKHTYFISMRFIWSAGQHKKKDIIDLIPEDFRYKGRFKKFCTLDDHVSMNKVLNNLAQENRHAFCLFFIMALFMNTKNRYFVTIKGLAKKIKKSLNYVTKLINVLIEKGFVRQDESCFVINSTIIWNRNQTKTFQNDIAEIFPQRKKRFSRHVKDNHEIMLMYLNAKRDMYLNNTLWKTFI